MKDILGIGKVLPIEKLIDVLSKSIGRVSKSYFDKIDIDTKAYEIKKLAEAKAEEMKIIKTAFDENIGAVDSIEYSDNSISLSTKNENQLQANNLVNNITLEERAKNRIDYKESKKQLNLESVSLFAAEELQNEDAITDEPLDEDWTTRFFNIVEDVSNEEMQLLWGKILAGELKQPNTYSLRTLELLRNLSKKEAEIFNKVANYALKVNNQYLLFNGNDDKYLSNNHNINYSDIALLTEIGLIQPGTFVQYTINQQNIDSKTGFIAGDNILIANIKANTPQIQMPVEVFSTPATELMNLIKPNPPINYLQYIANSIKSENVQCELAKINEIYSDGRINYNLTLQL